MLTQIVSWVFGFCGVGVNTVEWWVVSGSVSVGCVFVFGDDECEDVPAAAAVVFCCACWSNNAFAVALRCCLTSLEEAPA